ncbi:uncharacterized protein PG986_011399 [Apiospora aurea]|uniref:DUF7357 domain-containing protein n=1 Tax=Apiospora aurea TaxID=335848 RepID=A0ABR1Q696_9PEZI
MSQTHMRLNLAIRRNGLPEAKVVWPVPLEENPTISKLLEQVNDIIPLESSDWGLDDYAVELSAPDGSNFECLHFQPVRTVLQEGDHVRIRPLLTNDLKQRRLSGRYQISTDGKHLIDGIPFGRPLLKAPRGRPALDIPPRKRRRVALEEGSAEDSDPEEQEQDRDNSMLLLTNGEENDNGAKRVKINTVPQVFGDASDEEEDDSDFEEDEMEEEDSGLDDEDDAQDDESESVSDDEPLDEAMDDQDFEEEDHNEDAESEHEGSSQKEDEPDHDEKGDRNSPDQASVQPAAPKRVDLSALDGPSLLRAAFPSITVFCNTMLAKCGGNVDLAYKALRKVSEPVLPRDEFRKRSREQATEKGTAADADGVPRKASRKSRRALERPAPASESHDQAGLVDDEADSEGDEVDDFVKKFDHRPKAKSKPTTGGSDDSSSDSESESSNSGSDSDSDSGPEETSAKRSAKPAARGANSDSDSEDTSSDEDSSDSSDEESNSGHSDSESSDEDFAPGSGAQDSDSSSESESDSSSSDSEQEKSVPKSRDVERKPTVKGNQADRDANKQPQKTVVSAAQESQSSSGAAQQPESLVPPGSGKQATKQRNARRRLAARAQRMAAQAPENGADPGASMQADSTSQSGLQKSTQDAEKELFEAKRKALLDALNSGGAVVGPDGELEANEVEEDTTTISQKSNKRRRGDRSTPEPAVGEPGDTSVATPASQEADPEASAQKRRRVDLGAGRRMLFGALGLRNPKTKDDEKKLSAKLMENVRPLQNARLETSAAENADTMDTTTDPEVLEEDPDAWRDKIEYRAVECWYEGVELSEPPFPFEQRWDPQQRGNRSRKGKKSGGEAETAGQDQEETSIAGTKRKHDESLQPDEVPYYSYQGQAGSQDENLRLNYDDVEPELPMDKADHAQPDHSVAGTHYSDLDDLPSLPKDLAVLRQLQPGQAQVGMVITWKQFILSEAVNWQPQVMDLTGLITDVHGDEALEVILAKRDRHLERPEKQYDEHTGQRIYGRFEAPDDEDADEEDEDPEEEARRKLSFSVMDGYTTMMEPRVRQDPLTSPTAERRVDVSMDNPADEVIESGEATGNQDPADDGTTYPTFETTMDSRMEDARPSQDDNSLMTGPTNSSNGQPGQGHRFINVPISDFSQITSSSQREPGSQEARPTSHQPAEDWAVPPSDDAEPALPDGGRTTPTHEQSSVPTTHFNDTNGDILTGTPKSTYPKVVERPSSASSDHSGRQPDFDTTGEMPEPDSMKDATEGERGGLEISDQQESGEEAGSPPAPSTIRTSSPAAGAFEAQHDDDPDASSSSLPSLSTALRESSQRSSQWFGSQESRQQPHLPPDLSSENEEAMDDSQELPEQQNEEDSNIIPDSFQTAPQSKANMETSSMVGGDMDRRKTLASSQDPSTTRARGRVGSDISPPPVLRKTKSTSPFVKQRDSPPVPRSSLQHFIPPGTQVVEISSDSDSGHGSDSQSGHLQNSADEYDETGAPTESSTALPDGSGWVQKKLPEKVSSALSGRSKKRVKSRRTA